MVCRARHYGGNHPEVDVGFGGQMGGSRGVINHPFCVIPGVLFAGPGFSKLFRRLDDKVQMPANPKDTDLCKTSYFPRFSLELHKFTRAN